MPLVCPQCSRANPNEAHYCYFDGKPLGQRAGAAGPVDVGRQAFPAPFALAPGLVCKNFEELAVALSQNPKPALAALKSGALVKHLGSVGRADLAAAARKAAQSPDAENALDELLIRFPGADVLNAPDLVVEPSEINLGQLKIGEDRTFQLQLKNAGQRLLVGSVKCSGCDWLFFGGPQQVQQKLIRFPRQFSLPVQVRGKNLRASPQPLVGVIVVQTNGGEAMVRVQAEVKAKPFPSGALAGCVSVRQVAERAKAKPREVIPLLTNGALARWYQENGWRYPITGPTARGLAAIQQYFEALGVTKPPKVDISERDVALAGGVGEKLEHELRVAATEKRPVWAYGSCKDSWLQVSGARLKGNNAFITLTVPVVPGRAGDTWKTHVAITANGNQRFRVPVTLQVAGTAGAAAEAESGEAAAASSPWLSNTGRELGSVLRLFGAAFLGMEAPAAPAADSRPRSAPSTPAASTGPRTLPWWLLHVILPAAIVIGSLVAIFHDVLANPTPPPPPRRSDAGDVLSFHRGA